MIRNFPKWSFWMQLLRHLDHIFFRCCMQQNHRNNINMNCKCKNKALKMTGDRPAEKERECASGICAKCKETWACRNGNGKSTAAVYYYLFIICSEFSVIFRYLLAKLFRSLWFNNSHWIEQSVFMKWQNETQKQHAPYRFEAIQPAICKLKSNNKNRRHVNIIEIGANELWKMSKWTNERKNNQCSKRGKNTQQQQQQQIADHLVF